MAKQGAWQEIRFNQQGECFCINGLGAISIDDFKAVFGLAPTHPRPHHAVFMRTEMKLVKGSGGNQYPYSLDPKKGQE